MSRHGSAPIGFDDHNVASAGNELATPVSRVSAGRGEYPLQTYANLRRKSNTTFRPALFGVLLSAPNLFQCSFAEVSMGMPKNIVLCSDGTGNTAIKDRGTN